MPDLPVDPAPIVITASRTPDSEARTPASVTVVGPDRIERLGEPMLAGLLRLAPSVAVATSGPDGSLTEVRIRGAEANHSLLFIDGIKVNDPAAGDAPRFELLNADLASRLEVVRGPQSALWGSQAIGGVIAVNGLDTGVPPASGQAEVGGAGFRRLSAALGATGRDVSLAAAAGWQRARGIDSFDGHGDRDGFRNLSGRVRATWRPAPGVAIGAAAVALTGTSEFDGFDPLTFAHADTQDRSRNRLHAARAWAEAGGPESPWRVAVSGSLLASSNRNFLGTEPVNRTRGTRAVAAVQAERRFAAAGLDHVVIAAAELERETFTARDSAYGGQSNQDRDRDHRSLTIEWRAQGRGITGDVAVRRDLFNRFADTTSWRASAIAELGGGFALAGGYSEGIAQPTFFDLFGFFPDNFRGNPAIRAERSRGFELSLRYRRATVQGALALFRERLHDEIVDVFDFETFLFTTANRGATSRRSGVEGELAWAVRPGTRITATYAYLRAVQPDSAELTEVHELRRPRHSGSLAVDGTAGRISYGASLAFVGRRSDQRDSFPFDRVSLSPYVLGNARVELAVRPGLAVFARVSNALGARYQDVFGYRTEGRALFGGLRLTADRRSSP